MTTHPQPRVLLSGLAFVESARWHDDRLWFAHWGTDEIIAVDVAGNSEIVARGPGGLGWSFDWLPDGRMLVTGEGVSIVEADGTLAPYADLSALAADWNEIVVDGRANVYVNGGISFEPSNEPPGMIALVTPDRSVRQVATGLAFPNGMVVTSDNRTLIVAESFAGRLVAYDIADDGSLSNGRSWAAGLGPDGICLDAEGAVWAQTFQDKANIRVREGGQIVDRIALERNPFSCALGGSDGTTLFILAAEWLGVDRIDEAIAARTGQVLVIEAPAPRAGWP